MKALYSFVFESRPTAAAVFLLALGSCSSSTWDGAEAIHPTLAKGLYSIDRYYVDPVHIQGLSLAGIGAVVNLGDDLTLIPTAAHLSVVQNGDVLGRYPWPQTGSPGVWSLFSVAVLADLRQHSTTLSGLNENDILDSYFLGLTGGLDSFTRYASPTQALQQREDREGFGGIGITVENSAEGFRVVSVAPESPAHGVISLGEVILSVDGKPVEDSSVKQITEALHGRIGTMVRVTLRHRESSETYEHLLKRAEIIPNTVDLLLGTDYPTIRISRFNKKTADRIAHTVDALLYGSNEPLDGLVIDLRGNPGGLLNEAVETADLFLDHGVIASTEGRHPHSDQRFNATSGDIITDVPIVVLIDGGTASAAEILAAALQDHNRAVVVGSVSYGKGTVQKVVSMPNNGELALTWARYLTPRQYAIHDFGIQPTICTARFENGVAAVLKTLRKTPWQADMHFRYLKSLQHKGPATVEEFRAACPWSGQAPQSIDIDAAQALLGDRTLYKDALELGSRVYASK